jgi:hypothetical protein
MHWTVQYNWLFGTVYNSPPCGNIFSCIVICIHLIATICATKAFPLSFANMQTMGTGLRGISSRYNHQPDSIKPGLVTKILTQLVKTPSVQFSLLCLTFWLCRFADIAQLFNGYPLVFGFSFATTCLLIA